MLVVSLQAATPSINEEITDFSDTTSIVTLVHQGKETYYNRSQLDIAVREAQAGDTIMLGEGEYPTYTKNIEIDKPLTLIGIAKRPTYFYGKIIITKDISTFCLQYLSISSNIILKGKVNTFYIKNCSVDHYDDIHDPFMTNNQVGHLIVDTSEIKGETEQDSVTYTNCIISHARTKRHISYTHCDFEILSPQYYLFGNFTNCYLTAGGSEDLSWQERDATFSYCAITKSSMFCFKNVQLDHCIEVEGKSEQDLGNDGTPIGNNESWYDNSDNYLFLQDQKISLDKETKQIKIKASHYFKL